MKYLLGFILFFCMYGQAQDTTFSRRKYYRDSIGQKLPCATIDLGQRTYMTVCEDDTWQMQLFIGLIYKIDSLEQRTKNLSDSLQILYNPFGFKSLPGTNDIPNSFIDGPLRFYLNWRLGAGGMLYDLSSPLLDTVPPGKNKKP